MTGRYEALFNCDDSVLIVKTFKIVVVQLEEAEAVIRLVDMVIDGLHSRLDWESVCDQAFNEGFCEIQAAIGRYAADFYMNDSH